MDRLTLASRNAHKARELEVLLPGWHIEPLLVDDYPAETGTTYDENALLKASFAFERVGGWTLGEDSGIEVEALGGRPGLYSARYAEEGGPAIAKLLGELEGVAQRRARYVSELVAIAPDRTIVRGTGILEGAVADAPRGSGGFGYDPLFLDPQLGQTGAELPMEHKNRVSHRGKALAALAERLAAAQRGL
jgi:XTP/dITP diphosphohydrolase